jgi:hypothetical protein
LRGNLLGEEAKATFGFIAATDLRDVGALERVDVRVEVLELDSLQFGQFLDDRVGLVDGYVELLGCSRVSFR